MATFNCKIQCRYFVKNFPTIFLYSTATPSFSNYLVNSLGFSQQQAAVTCTKLPINKVNHFKFHNNAISVVDFLKNRGFDDSNVRKAVSLDPRILCSKVDKTLKPKFELLQKEGFSGSDLVRVISASPHLSVRSMNDVIWNLKDVLGSVEIVRKLFSKGTSYTTSISSLENVITNIAFLKNDYGIDINVIRNTILLKHVSFRRKPEFFRNAVVRVQKELGIPCDSKMFFCGIQLCCLSKENVESKCQVFKSFGWTEDQVYELMRRFPIAFCLSEKNIRKRLSFCMNVLGYNPDFFASHSALFTCSLEKRILPRYRVFLVLKEKGLLDYSFYTAIISTETKFLKIFVEPFKEDVPGLLEIYQTSEPNVEPLSTVIPN